VPRDFDEVKKLATLPTRTVSLCLAGELVEEIAQLELQLAEAKPPVSLGDASPKRLIAEQLAAVQDRMREATVDFYIRAMGSRVWSLFWAGMPTQGEKEPDAEWSDRVFPFYVDLVSRSCADPVMNAEQVAELADLLHHRAWSDLVTACLKLNMGEVNIPNSDAASELTQSFDQT